MEIIIKTNENLECVEIPALDYYESTTGKITFKLTVEAIDNSNGEIVAHSTEIHPYNILTEKERYLKELEDYYHDMLEMEEEYNERMLDSMEDYFDSLRY